MFRDIWLKECEFKYNEEGQYLLQNVINSEKVLPKNLRYLVFIL